MLGTRWFLIIINSAIEVTVDGKELERAEQVVGDRMPAV